MQTRKAAGSKLVRVICHGKLLHLSPVILFWVLISHQHTRVEIRHLSLRKCHSTTMTTRPVDHLHFKKTTVVQLAPPVPVAHVKHGRPNHPTAILGLLTSFLIRAWVITITAGIQITNLEAHVSCICFVSLKLQPKIFSSHLIISLSNHFQGCYTTDPAVRWEYCGIPDCEDDPATLNEYMEYRITWTATRNATSDFLQFGELEVYGLLGAHPVMPTLEYEGDYVSTITNSGETEITLMGGYTTGQPNYAINGNTGKFFMYKENATDVAPGAYLNTLNHCPQTSLTFIVSNHHYVECYFR